MVNFIPDLNATPIIFCNRFTSTPYISAIASASSIATVNDPTPPVIILRTFLRSLTRLPSFIKSLNFFTPKIKAVETAAVANDNFKKPENCKNIKLKANPVTFLCINAIDIIAP